MDELLKIFQLLGTENCLKYLVELPQFYISPVKTLKLYFSKSDKDKFSQSTFYVLIGISFLLIFFSQLSLVFAVKIVIVELFGILFLPLLGLGITNKIVFKIRKQKARLLDIYLFLVLTRFLCYPCMFISYSLFMRLENYHFLFAFYLLLVLLIFIQWFGPILFFYKPKNLPLSLSIQFVVYNIFILLVSAALYFIQVTSENKLDLSLDPINDEYDNATKVLHSFLDHNIIKATFIGEGQAINFAIDSSRYEDFSTCKKIPFEQYLNQTDSIGRQLHTCIKNYDSVYPHIKYKINKTIFQAAKSIDSSYLAEINMNERSIPTNNSSPVLFKKSFFVSTVDTNKFSVLLFFSFSLKLSEMRFDYAVKHDKYINKAIYAYSPLNIFVYSTFIGFIPEEKIYSIVKKMD